MVHVHAPRKICLELRECDLLKDERVSELENVLSDATQCMKPLKILTPELTYDDQRLLFYVRSCAVEIRVAA